MTTQNRSTGTSSSDTVPAGTGSISDPTRPAQPETAPSTPPSRRLWQLTFWLLVALFVSENNVDPDLWGHVQYGLDLLRTGVIPRTDPYSYLSGSAPWINHELLAEVVLAALSGPGGSLILLFKVALGLLTVGLVWWPHRQRSIPLPLLFLFLLPWLEPVSLGWAARPQLFSYFFFALLLRLLQRADHTSRSLWWTVPLTALWINFHGGFLFGLAVLWIHQVVRVFAPMPADLPTGARLKQLLIPALASLATLLNPYGYEMHLGIYRELGIERLQIREWGALSWTSLETLPINLVLVLSLGLAAWGWKRLPLDRRVLLLILGIQTQLHIRHGVFLSLAALFWLPPLLEAFARRPDSTPHLRGWALPLPALRRRLGQLLLLLLATGSLILAGSRLTGMRVMHQRYPVGAFQYLAAQGLKGRMVTPFNWAQYVIHCFTPDVKVSFDGRYGTVYPPEILDLNFDLWYPDDPSVRSRAESSGPMDPTRVLTVGDPSLVLVDRKHLQGEAVLRAQSDWVLLYEDSVAQIYGRKDVYDRPGSRDYLPVSRRISAGLVDDGWSLYPACPGSP